MDAVMKPFRENEDFVRERINYGIELYRKGYNTIRFTDKEGNPVTNVKFSIKLKKHDYKFGCNIFMLDEFENEDKNAEYRKLFGDTFNYATAPFYWRDLEPEKGKPRYDKFSQKVYRRPAPDLVLEYCEEKNIDVKAHCIVYDAFSPDWLPREVPLIKKEYDKHMAELSARYSARIDDWEIINETLNWEMYGYSRLKTSAFFQEADYETWSYFAARRNFPINNLLINAGPCEAFSDRLTRSHYYYQLESLASKGVHYDGIGMQAHIFCDRKHEADFISKYYNPVKMYDVFDAYEKFGSPIQISELTIPSYNGGVEDEEVQAEELKTLYSLWFAHRATDSIVYWNLVDGYSYVPGGGKDTLGDLNAGENIYGGGLIRFDMTPKPAFLMLRNLIKNEWYTELDLNTGDCDRAKFKGFFGIYDLTYIYNGREEHTEFHLDKRSDLEHIIVCD